MPKISFDYVEGYPIDKALYDEKRSFYIKLRRANVVEPSNLRMDRALNGDVRYKGSYYDRDLPVLWFPTGEMVLLRRCGEPQHRGRYTFGGYDFTIMSTSNDNVFKKAVEFISFSDEVKGLREEFLPKMNLPAFNVRSNGDIDGQAIVVDHVNNRVYGLGNEMDPVVPEHVSDETWCVYARTPQSGFVHRKRIRTSTLRNKRNLPEGYEALVTQCRAWFAHEGSDLQRILSEENPSRPVSNYDSRLGTVIDPQYAVNQGFAGLTPVQRGQIARNNVLAKLPRMEKQWHTMRFDSAKFFAATY